jgi:hypothetical protein
MAIQIDAHFIGLHLPEVARLHDLGVVDGFGMLAGRFEPSADRLGLEAKGMFKGDQGTAPTDQRDDLDDACLGGAAAMKDRAGAGAKGLATDVTAVAPLLLTMHADVALPNLASCRTVQVGAPYRLRIHGSLLLFGHTGFSMDPLIC